MTRRKGDNYLGQEKQKQPRPHYALINKTIIWYGFLVLCLAGALVQTYIHTYITHISSNCCFQSHAPMVFFCVFQDKYSHGFNAAEMQGANQTLCLLPGMYVCMYVFIRILPAGWEACQFIQSMHDSVSDTETAVILYLIH